MESFVQTKSLRKIFTPIVSQVTELMIITSDCENENGSPPESANLILPLVSMSEDIVHTLNDLTTVCKQTVAIDYPSDELAKEEVDFASQNLLVSSESLVLCCHILCSSPVPNFQLKTPMPHQGDVASCLADLNQCLLLLLLSVDDAEVRKIADTGKSASEGLALLTTAETVQILKDQFRSFAISIAALHSSSSARCVDLLDSKDQYNLKCCLTTLRQSLPMLTAALQMAIRYPSNAEVLKGRNFCVEQVRKAIEDVIRIVTTKRSQRHFLPNTKKGFFIEKLEDVATMLSSGNQKDLDMISLNCAIETVVQQSIELSLVLSESGLSLKSTATVKCCRKLMRTLRQLEKSDEECEKQKPGRNSGAMREENRTKLRSVSQGVLATLVHAVSALVVHTFTSTDEPLESIINTCIPPIREETQELCDLQNEKASGKIESAIQSFQQHVKSVATATKFAAACCSDPAVYQKYSKVSMSFEQNSNAIILVARDYFKKNDLDENELVQHDRILDLKERWIANISEILQLIIASLNLKELLDVIVAGVSSSAEKCIEGVANLDETFIATHMQKLTGKARFLIGVANSVVACSTEPVYRNGVLAHVKGLKQNIASVVAHGHNVIEDVARVSEQGLFQGALKTLEESVKTVAKAVLSDGNHPDLTSMNRMNVRDDDGSSFAVTQGLHSLNEKLSAMGFEPITDDEMKDPFPVPTSSEPGWPRYFYKDEAPMKHSSDDVMLDTVSESDRLSEYSQAHLHDIESLPGKVHPIIAKLLDCIKKTHSSKSAKSWELDDTKEMLSRASEICNDIAKEALSGLPTDIVTDGDKQSVQKASVRIRSVADLILKEVDDLCLTPKDEKLEMDSIELLGTQWSQALYIVSIGCVKILPLYTVPVRRYLASSLETDVEDVHNLARYLVNYPGTLSKFIDKLADYKEEKKQSDEDSAGMGDFNIHEQNVKELVELVGAISKLFKMVCDAGVEGFKPDQVEEATGLFEIIDFDWSSACKCREEMLELVDAVSPNNVNNPLDKAMLQLLCLSWACKVHSLHSTVFKLVKLILEFFVAEVKAVSLYEMVADKDRASSREIKAYRQRILIHVADQDRSIKTARHTENLITWHENLRDTADVIEETLDYLCTKRTSIPLVHHHGHTMFHLLYLHHLFYLELAYINLSIIQPTTDDEASEISESEDPSIHIRRPTLSARLRALKEEREMRDESLQDLLVDIPKTDL